MWHKCRRHLPQRFIYSILYPSQYPHNRLTLQIMYAPFSLPNSNLGPAFHPPSAEEQNENGAVVTAAGNSSEARGRFRCAASTSMLFSMRTNLHIRLSTPRALPCPEHARSLRHFQAHTPVALGGPDVADLPRQLPCPVMLQHARVGCQAEGARRACLEFFDSDTGRFRPSRAQHDAHLARLCTMQPKPSTDLCTLLSQPPGPVMLLLAHPPQRPAA